MHKLLLLLTLTVVQAEATYSQYHLINEYTSNDSKICVYENARGGIYTKVQSEHSRCAYYVNTDRE